MVADIVGGLGSLGKGRGGDTPCVAGKAHESPDRVEDMSREMLAEERRTAPFCTDERT